jgi:hypothetical protein
MMHVGLEPGQFIGMTSEVVLLEQGSDGPLASVPGHLRPDRIEDNPRRGPMPFSIRCLRFQDRIDTQKSGKILKSQVILDV